MDIRRIRFRRIQCGCAGCRVYPSPPLTCSVDVQGVSLTPACFITRAVCIHLHYHQLWACRMYPSSSYCRVDVQGVSLSYVSRAYVQGVSLFAASSIDVQGVSFSNIHTMFLNAGMPGCTASGQSGTGMNKNANSGSSLVPEKGTQPGNGMLRYRTEKLGAGTPMPMPMPMGLDNKAHLWKFW
jgi:hypothetical protein